jgi:hypothetical protein
LSSKGVGVLRFLPGFPEAQEERVTYAFSFRPDGSFRCEDVLAGAYQLSISVYDLPVPNK